MRILFYGDSNTWGYDQGRRNPKRFTRLLSGHEVIEEGLNGRTFCHDDPYEPHRNGAKDIGRALLTHGPVDALIIMLGTNDLKREFAPDIDSCGRSLRRFLFEVQSPIYYRHAPMPKVHVLMPPLIARQASDAQIDPEAIELMYQLAPVYQKICDDFKVEFHDFKIVADGPDGVHLADHGHALYAQALQELFHE